MKQFALEYDTDYGIDKRSGWTVKIEGAVVVQFRRWMLWALVEAWWKWRQWK